MRMLFSEFHWFWLTLCALFLMLEIIVPGFYFACIGLAAFPLFLLVLLFDIPFLYQLFLFGVFLFASIPVASYFYKGLISDRDGLSLNNRMEGYIGSVWRLDSSIKDGRGQISLDDSLWDITGPDLPAGSKVRIIGVDDLVLRVEFAGDDGDLDDSDSHKIM